MTRQIDRSIARDLYARFARNWRKELRLAGLYGKPGSPKRPTFSQWYKMHERDAEMMRESTPQDVAEYMGDPWAAGEAAKFEVSTTSKDGEELRGVVEIPIGGDDDPSSRG